MTLAAVWRVQQRVYAAADTRISQTKGNVLTEHGPKLLPITLVCKEEDPEGPVVHAATFGYAYAGATLPAMSTHALANTLLSNLMGIRGSAPPGLDDVARTISDVALHYMREVGQLNPAGALFSTIVFGWCLRENRFRAFQISPCIAPSSVAIESKEHDLEAHENLMVIGTCPDLLRDRIRRERPNYYPGASTPEEIALREIDLPKRALQSLIAERADPSVGGAIQYGWATRFGFAPASIMVPGAGMTVLGFTVNYVQVGSYVVSMVGRL